MYENLKTAFENLITLNHMCTLLFIDRTDDSNVRPAYIDFVAAGWSSLNSDSSELGGCVLKGGRPSLLNLLH
jgi:hypothetical protein